VKAIPVPPGVISFFRLRTVRSWSEQRHRYAGGTPANGSTPPATDVTRYRTPAPGRCTSVRLAYDGHASTNRVLACPHGDTGTTARSDRPGGNRRQPANGVKIPNMIQVRYEMKVASSMVNSDTTRHGPSTARTPVGPKVIRSDRNELNAATWNWWAVAWPPVAADRGDQLRHVERAEICQPRTFHARASMECPPSATRNPARLRIANGAHGRRFPSWETIPAPVLNPTGPDQHRINCGSLI
jgi:hypothetical protein